MRKKIDLQCKIKFGINNDQKVITDHQLKYNKIDELLEKKFSILDIVHGDLKNLGTESGQLSRFTTDHLFRSILIRHIERLSYRNLIIRINDSMFFRNFTHLGMAPIMGYSLVETAEKLIQPSTWEKINLILSNFAITAKLITGDLFRLDSTVTESNIHFPTDSSLLWDCYRTISRIMTNSHKEHSYIPYSYRFNTIKVKALHTFVSTRCSAKKKSVKRKVRESLLTMLDRVATANTKAESFIAAFPESCGMTDELKRVVELSKKIVKQITLVHVDKVPVKGNQKIYSIFEEHTELLMRGKSNKPTEFGHLVSLGQTAEKFISYYKVEEKSQHDTVHKKIALDDHNALFGDYPKAFTADKNYYESMDDIEELEEIIDLVAIGKKGRRTAQEEEREHSLAFRMMQRFRAGCEGTISVLKRAYGLKRCLLKGYKSFASLIGTIVFCHNAVLLSRLT